LSNLLFYSYANILSSVSTFNSSACIQYTIVIDYSPFNFIQISNKVIIITLVININKKSAIIAITNAINGIFLLAIILTLTNPKSPLLRIKKCNPFFTHFFFEG
jgi:hypothetical protein